MMGHSWVICSPLWGKGQEVGVLAGEKDGLALQAKKAAVSRKRRMDTGEMATNCFIFCVPLLFAPQTLYTFSHGFITRHCNSF